MTFRSTFLAFILFLAAFGAAEAQNYRFNHYLGAANTTYDERGMQQVYEVEYYKYVDDSRSALTLHLPLANSNDDEPHAYFRWYDLNTDEAADNLTAKGGSNYFVNYYDATNTSINRGLFYYNSSNTGSTSYQTICDATYSAPTAATSADWEGVDIACDISRYFDNTSSTSTSGSGWNRVTTYTRSEPTLSIRYIFHIRSGKKLANDIKNALMSEQGTDMTYEDEASTFFGAQSTSTLVTLRLNLHNYSDYYFYPLTSSALSKHLYHPATANAENTFTDADFDTSSLVQCNAVRWKAYTSNYSKYAILSAGTADRFFQFSISDLNSATWYNLDGSSTTRPTFTNESRVYIVGELRGTKSGSYVYCPVTNYNIKFGKTYPMTHDEIVTNDGTRLISYLNTHYTEAFDPITFDNWFDDTSAPTSATTNVVHSPLPWDQLEYSFVYYDQLSTSNGLWGNKGYGPVHGDYCLYKSACIAGISQWKWWLGNSYGTYNASYPFYDRTYETTNGKQYGGFLYFDASDESRKIVHKDFQTDLCAGMRLIFYAGVADMTVGDEKANISFKLYGLDKDENGDVTGEHLLVTFPSGYIKNTDGGNIATTGDYEGKWYQVFTKCTLPNYTEINKYKWFRVTLDNMCTNTSGADYAIDEIRFYIKDTKVDVIQSEPVCPEDADKEVAPTNVKFKVRMIYDVLSDLLISESRKVFYRFCDASGKPLRFDYDGDGTIKDYGTIDVPEEADLTDTEHFEKGADSEIYYILCNRHYDIPQGQVCFVSIGTPSVDNPDEPFTWGNPSDKCSTYSSNFSVIQQTLIINDATSEIAANATISCDDDTMKDYTISAKLTTVDAVEGGSVTLESVKFDWFVGEKNAGTSNITTIEDGNLLAAIQHFRSVYPDASVADKAALNHSTTTPAGWDNSSGSWVWKPASTTEDYPTTGLFTDTDKELLGLYLDKGTLALSASSGFTQDNLTFDAEGIYTIAAIPVATSVTVSDQVYSICSTPQEFKLRVQREGPRADLGFDDVSYPEAALYTNGLRLGLPHLATLKKYHGVSGKGLIRIPVKNVNVAAIKFTETGNDELDGRLHVMATNDPAWTDDLATGNTDIATIENVTILQNQMGTDEAWLNLTPDADLDTRLHEGYWYDATLSFKQQQQSNYESILQCPGSLTFRIKVVPENVTWTPSTVVSTCWNNDADWKRSTAEELRRTDGTYTDDADAAGFVPMAFTNVTVKDVAAGGIAAIAPTLSYITKNAYGQATRLNNDKSGKATDNIQYDFALAWDNDLDEGTADGNFKCIRFYGNTCDEIVFQPGGELLGQSFLNYRRAWVEKELVPNTWYAVSSPLKDTYAGDFYAPFATDGQQTTPSFEEINFDQSLHSRAKYPFYQRAWDKVADEVIADGTTYSAYDYAGTGITDLGDISETSAQWSHTYNDVTVPYAAGQGHALRAGDAHFPKDKSENALVRLPKADTEYTYYNTTSASTVTAALAKDSIYRLNIAPDNSQSALASVSVALTPVNTGNNYYLVGNPYTASVSMYSFLKANTQLEPKVWWLEGGVMKSKEVDVEADYNKDEDVKVTATQAFFVKVRDGETAGSVRFTSEMTTDRAINAGSLKVRALNAERRLTLSVARGATTTATATVRLDAAATRTYDESEDVQLFADGLSDIPTVYTVADDRAVSVNATPTVEWLPLGITDGTDEDVQLTVTGSRVNFGSLNLYDAATRTFTAITSGSPLTVRAGQHGRYFLTTQTSVTGIDATDADALRCYSPAARTLVVTTSAATPLTCVSIYGTDGRLVTTVRPDGAISRTFSVPAGLYVVRAADARTEKTFKVSVGE